MGGAKAETGPAPGRGAGNSATNSAQKQKEGADLSAKGGSGLEMPRKRHFLPGTAGTSRRQRRKTAPQSEDIRW